MTKFVQRPIYKAVDIAGREPPNDTAAERELVAVGFASTEILDALADVVTIRDFYSPAFGRVWDAMQSLRVQGKPVDLTTVIGRLRERDEIASLGDDTTGGVKFVTDIALDAPTEPEPDLAYQYAQTVRELAHRRKIVHALSIALGEGYSGRTAHREFVESVESAIFHATRGFTTDSDGHDMERLIADEEKRIADVEAGRVSSGGIPFGFPALDAMIGGGGEGEVTIVCGRPSMGKTSLLRDIAVNVAASNHDGMVRGVIIESLEMPKEKFRARMISAHAAVPLKKIIGAKLYGDDAERRRVAMDQLRALPMVIEDAPGLTPTKLRSRLRRAMMRFNNDRQRISLVAIDQLMWMRPEQQYGSGASDNARRLGDMLLACVEIAKETKVHMLIAHQLNRDVKNRNGKDTRPRMTDLAESGHIEMHAANIIAVHRPAFYFADQAALTDDQKRLVECIVLKQRDGARGIVRLDWHAECARFRSEGDS